MTPVLQVSNLRKSFGGITAVDGVSFEVREGEILGIIGPNGSGKSTLFNCVLGQLAPSDGEVRIDGKPTTGMRPCDLNRLGVSRTFQLLQVFPQLSVRDNLRIGGYTIRHRKQLDRRIDELLEAFPRLRERYDVQAGQLSGGEQMILSIARALVLNPRFLLFDEPSAGLSPKLVGDVLVRAAELARRGVGVIMIEQNIREALRVADRLYVLVGGQNRFEGTPADVEDDRELMHLYLGGR